MIEGKVAKILSETEVVLNVGARDGVKSDMEFVIFAVGAPISDPDTGELLGSLETVKGRVKVYYVMERMARARTLAYKVTTEPSYLAAFRIGAGTLGETVETRQRKLSVRKGDLDPTAEDTTVHVGDSVKSV
jgi:hypothetical protein